MEQAARLRRIWRRDNKQRRRRLGMSGPTEATSWLDETNGPLEFAVMKKLVGDIEKHGYVRNDGIDGDVSAVAMIDTDNTTRFIIRSGKHRIAAVSALGIDTVPLRLNARNCVRLSEVEFWPSVQKGRLTAKQAREVFERIFLS
ncbi:hypothetical protein [Pelagibacterium montanilacus]|uniref:hypothetical protein n=1 Tax=Pelagibacterium montanilacus TaxID=2185280 RepID=UPI000F8CCEA2|nr:hypothetical protein [Pelagibacterium montanilacus]